MIRVQAIGLFVVGAVLLGGITYALYWSSRNRCVRLGEVMQLVTQFSSATDCMIQIDGAWIPLDAYVVVRK